MKSKNWLIQPRVNLIHSVLEKLNSSLKKSQNKVFLYHLKAVFYKVWKNASEIK